VTHRPIREEADSTRVYADYHRYTPVPPEKRKYAVRKPDDPRAVRYNADWFLPLEVLPDQARSLPETRPDDACLEHPASCRCDVCRRPQATILWRRRADREARARARASRPTP
jgi:hypothetical protein